MCQQLGHYQQMYRLSLKAIWLLEDYSSQVRRLQESHRGGHLAANVLFRLRDYLDGYLAQEAPHRGGRPGLEAMTATLTRHGHRHCGFPSLRHRASASASTPITRAAGD